MQRNVWRASPGPNKTDTKNRSIVKRLNNEKSFSFGSEKSFAEGSQGNGFKSDQESHNNQNLLDDVSHSSCDECTNDLLFGEIKVFFRRNQIRAGKFWMRSKFAKYD